MTNALQQVSSNLSIPSNQKINGIKGGFSLTHFPTFFPFNETKTQNKASVSWLSINANSALKQASSNPTLFWVLFQKSHFPLTNPAFAVLYQDSPTANKGLMAMLPTQRCSTGKCCHDEGVGCSTERLMWGSKRWA